MQSLMLRFIFFGFLARQLHIALCAASAAEPKNEIVTLNAKPEPLAIDPAQTAVIVVDMENDFVAKGGMFDRAGADISDLGAPDSVNRTRHLKFGVGQKIRAPDGRESRILSRDTWDTDIVPELKPQDSDIVIYKTRFSGFYQTDLDATMRKFGIKYLIVAGVTTSICVESTVRDAMFRDYLCVLLS